MNVYWAHSGEHLWRVREEKEGRYLLWVPMERLDLLWVPLADYYEGLRGVLAPASYGHMWYLRFVGLFVHATYPL